MSHLTLHFSNHRSVALESVEFSHPLLREARFSYRGKGFSDVFCMDTFQWSPAVRALSVLFLWTKANHINYLGWPSPPGAALGGSGGSLAASLDYALSKKPLWLLDMFGVNSNGDALARSLFVRWNAERKRGGDVIVTINPSQLSSDSIVVTVNGVCLNEAECVALAESITRLQEAPGSFNARKSDGRHRSFRAALKAV